MNIQTSTILLNDLPENARIVSFGHRSGCETHERCPRAYFYNYEYMGTGITPSPGPLYFTVGSAVHHGLACMLLGNDIDTCVNKALDELRASAAYQILRDESKTEQETLVHGLLYAFWVYAMPGIRENFEVICVETGAVEFLPLPYETCGIICEDVNNTSNSGIDICQLPDCHYGECSVIIDHPLYVAMQSRPDAILRHKKTGEVAGWSWKTIDDPTDMRRSQLHNDLQGFMEMYYGEKILEKFRGAPVSRDELKAIMTAALEAISEDPSTILATLPDFIHDLQQLEDRARAARNIPTQIDYIQTVFLVKGKRQRLESEETPFFLSAETYTNDTDEWGGYNPEYVYRQMSHLCYRYRNSEQTEEPEIYKTGPNKGKPKPVAAARLADESWAYRFYVPNNSTMSGLSTKWLTSPIQPENVREWVDRLNVGEVFPSTLNDERNPHPLAKIIRFEEPLYRNGDKAARHVEQQRNRLVQIAGSVQRVNDTLTDYLNGGIDNEPSRLQVAETLDREFPQHLINCRTPFKCAYFDFCHTPREAEIDFLNVPNGFEVRAAHHQFEQEMREKEMREKEIEVSGE